MHGCFVLMKSHQYIKSATNPGYEPGVKKILINHPITTLIGLTLNYAFNVCTIYGSTLLTSISGLLPALRISTYICLFRQFSTPSPDRCFAYLYASS